jgi:hypothetical protein
MKFLFYIRIQKNLKYFHIENYLLSHGVKKFIFFHGKQHPMNLGEKEINQFLTHLAVRDKVSASTQNSPREIKP